MKRLLLMAFIATLFISCVDQPEVPNNNKETDNGKIEIAESLITTMDYDVPVVEGQVTTVSYKGMLLARTSTPLKIKVPKEAIARSSDGLSVTYSEGQASQPFSNLWQTVLFEDSKNGDWDYNDIVIHTNYKINGSKLSVGIHPIALGSTKNIKIGFRWTQAGKSEEVIVASNAREELFGGMQGFINTRAYDIHYDSFVKEIDATLADESSVVNIDWFIIVDNGIKLFAVNQSGDKCIDDKGMPYGFALTNVNGDNSNRSYAKASGADTKEWEAYKFDIDSWAYMPEMPSVPSGAVDMKEYQTWSAKDKNYIVKSGDTYNGDLKLDKNITFFVEGTMSTTNIWGNGPANIVVLPGGTLNIKAGFTYQNVSILNYGNMVFPDGEVVFGSKSELKTVKNIVSPNTLLKVENGAVFYAQSDVELENIAMSNQKTYMYCNSANVGKEVYLTNNSTMYVNGPLAANTIKLNSNTQLYVDCRLRANDNIYITNHSYINAKSYISTPKLDMTSDSEINVMSDALIEVKYLTTANTSSTNINVVGSAMAALVTDELSISGSLQLNKFFTGNLGVVFNKLYEKTNPIELDNPRITLPGNNVLFNSEKIAVPENECSPGYNTYSPSDSGNVWFSYPMENINIASCYNFESWKKGVFDFTKLPGAQLFDVTDSNPRIGTKDVIYKMK